MNQSAEPLPAAAPEDVLITITRPPEALRIWRECRYQLQCLVREARWEPFTADQRERIEAALWNLDGAVLGAVPEAALTAGEALSLQLARRAAT